MKQEIKARLQKIADQEYQKFNVNLCPGIDNILGVRVPILRNYAKELLKENSIEVLLENIDNQYYEEIMLQGMLIGLDKKQITEELFDRIRHFTPKINNWAICDVFCSGLKQTNQYPIEMWNLLQEYLKSDKEFEIRFAVVMILDYYMNEDYLERNYIIFSKIHHDGYYVKMAVAWAISIGLVKYYEKTVTYLKECQLDKFTYNKAIQKAIESYQLTKEQKEFLRKMKK